MSGVFIDVDKAIEAISQSMERLKEGNEPDEKWWVEQMPVFHGFSQDAARRRLSQLLRADAVWARKRGYAWQINVDDQQKETQIHVSFQFQTPQGHQIVKAMISRLKNQFYVREHELGHEASLVFPLDRRAYLEQAMLLFIAGLLLALLAAVAFLVTEWTKTSVIVGLAGILLAVVARVVGSKWRAETLEISFDRSSVSVSSFPDPLDSPRTLKARERKRGDGSTVVNVTMSNMASSRSVWIDGGIFEWKDVDDWCRDRNMQATFKRIEVGK